MIDNLESKITFEIPNGLDFDKLIRVGGQNYSSFWQNLHYQQDLAARAAGMGTDYNASAGADFNLLNSLQSFASRSSSGSSSASGSGGVLLGDGSEQLLDPTYERFIGDVWVGIVLTLMILSSIFCMCSCFLYHKFRQWQRSVLTARSQTLSSMDVETPPPYDVESLPSYTIVSGLPSYSDAIEQLKQKQLQRTLGGGYSGYEPVKLQHASVIKLFESQSQELGVAQPAKPQLEEIRYNFGNVVPAVAAAAAIRTNGAGNTGAAELEGVEVVNEVSPTTSSNSQSTAVTAPSYKGHAAPVAVEVGDGTVIAVSLKKFHVSRFTVEDELSNGVS
uniref:Putative conserved plasma membrane protein n=1 Tax=Culex tarsalis TaxID=7177 RepID=A0A1Q3G0C2_CULTA